MFNDNGGLLNTYDMSLLLSYEIQFFSRRCF